MKKLLFNSLISSLVFVSCNSTTIDANKLDSTVSAVDTLRPSTSDSTTVTDTTLEMKNAEMKEERKEISSEPKKENNEMPEHHAPNQSKVDSIKNSYPKKK